MRPFAYARAGTVDEALAAAAQPRTALLAGGTELLNWMRLGLDPPERVIDVTRVPGLDAIESLAGGGLRIGATARLNDVAADARVRSDWPVLREAIHKAASAQLRNLATIGGNLLQKTRCAYFRSEGPGVPCNRRVPGSGCAAIHGHGDRHALFGWTEQCIATHPADPPVALARARRRSADPAARRTRRRIPVGELYVLPGERVDADTVLDEGELIVALELPAPAPRSAYVKVRERESYEYALVVRRRHRRADRRRHDLRCAHRPRLGRHASVAPGDGRATSPWPAAGRARGHRGARAALADARPAAGSGYKVAIAVGAARRALLHAAGAAA